MTVSGSAGRRLLVIVEVFPPRPGGSGRWLWELYRRFPSGSVCVLAGEAPDSVAFDREQPFPIVRTGLRFKSWGLRSAVEYARALREALRRSRTPPCDVTHCGKALPEGLIGWALRRLHGRPYCVYAHGEELTLAHGSRELAALTRLVFRGASLVIANSDHTRTLLVDRWSAVPDRVQVLHPGVDVERFRPAPRSAAVRSHLGWGDRPVVLTVGALQKRKGQDTMIRALPALAADFPRVLYAVAGDGWEREYLERLARDLEVRDHVQFRGVASEADLVTCYQQCDVFALPNRQVGWDFEGFGIALLEAQACGRPVIAGASGGTAEALDAPRTGVRIPCESPEPLVDAVRRLLCDPDSACRLGLAGREWVAANRSWEAASAHARALLLGA